jgi:hypothetical protein
MTICYQIFELRKVGENVTFAGYSDGYGKESEEIIGSVRPTWAHWSYDSEEDVLLHLNDKGDAFTDYEIKKIYRSE